MLDVVCWWRGVVCWWRGVVFGVSEGEGVWGGGGGHGLSIATGACAACGLHLTSLVTPAYTINEITKITVYGENYRDWTNTVIDTVHSFSI